MITVQFQQAGGEKSEVQAAPQTSLMRAAIDNGVPGIIAECGGNCVCATCHCYVDSAWADKLPPIGAEEEAMLDFAWERKPTSRLSCQITLTPEIDQLLVHVPLRQNNS